MLHKQARSSSQHFRFAQGRTATHLDTRSGSQGSCLCLCVMLSGKSPLFVQILTWCQAAHNPHGKSGVPCQGHGGGQGFSARTLLTRISLSMCVCAARALIQHVSRCLTECRDTSRVHNHKLGKAAAKTST